LEWGGDGVGGAGVEAAAAGAAAVALGGVGLEFEGSEDFAEENPIAERAADEVGVLADEAEAGALGEIAFEDRAGVGVPERTRMRRDRIDESGESAETFTKKMMIVIELGVAGDFAPEERRRGRGRLSIIVDNNGDDRFGAGKDLGGIEALGGVALKPGHFAVMADIEPLLEMAGVIGRSGGSKPTGVEAEFEGALADLILQAHAAA